MTKEELEKQIFKTMINRTHPMAGHSWLIGLDSSDCKLCSEEIVALKLEGFYEKEFVEWIGVETQKSKLWLERSGNFYNIFDRDDDFTLDELHDYWEYLNKEK